MGGERFSKKGEFDSGQAPGISPGGIIAWKRMRQKENAMSLFKRKEGPPAATGEAILSALSGVMDPELGRELVSLSRIRNVKQRDVLPTFQKRRGTFLQLFLQSS